MIIDLFNSGWHLRKRNAYTLNSAIIKNGLKVTEYVSPPAKRMPKVVGATLSSWLSFVSYDTNSIPHDDCKKVQFKFPAK